MMTKKDIAAARLPVRILMMITSLVTTWALLGPTPVQASPERVTHGDAQAVLRTAATGGGAIRNHDIVNPAAPADIELRASIRPVPGSMFDGRHYCAEDWHVILALVFEGGDQSFTMQDARAVLDPLSFQFLLNGVLLPTERQPIKRLLAPQSVFEVSYYVQQGVVLPPDALTVGEHALTLIETGPSGNFVDETTFFIDALVPAPVFDSALKPAQN